MTDPCCACRLPEMEYPKCITGCAVLRGDPAAIEEFNKWSGCSGMVSINRETVPLEKVRKLERVAKLARMAAMGYPVNPTLAQALRDLDSYFVKT